MEAVVYIAAAVMVGILLVLVALLKKFTAAGSANPVPEEDGAVAGARPAARNRGAAPIAGGARRRAPRINRLAEARRQEAGDSDEDQMVGGVPIDLPDEKIGAKKLKKLQDKAEKKAQREAEQQEREERKRREALAEERRKKQEAEEEAREQEQVAEEQKLKEEQERRDHEEYLKLRAGFSVEEEGTNEAELDGDGESVLQEFINYIKDMKVVMLEDLASHFKLKTQDAIDRVTTLRDEGLLTGVLDDRGKFIYITQDEYEAVAKFIRQRGRVSRTELAESSNNLINLNPDNKETMHRKLVGEMEVEA